MYKLRESTPLKELNGIILSRGAAKLHWKDPLYRSLIIRPRKNRLGPRLEVSIEHNTTTVIVVLLCTFAMWLHIHRPKNHIHEVKH